MKETLNKYKHIRTVSGQYVNVFDPDPDTILISDIAHALSNQCRFGGHLPRFYSVAQHSFLCYQMASSKNKFNALMHDASEAYLLDFPKPIKLHISQYNEIESNLMEVISKKFGFGYPKNKEVEKIDHFMLQREWNCIMLKRKIDKFKSIKCWSAADARKMFMHAFIKETKEKAPFPLWMGALTNSIDFKRG